jgi:hypothetical protein
MPDRLVVVGETPQRAHEFLACGVWQIIRSDQREFGHRIRLWS